MITGLHASETAADDDLRARLAAGAAAATDSGIEDVPHRKHSTGAPFRSRRR